MSCGIHRRFRNVAPEEVMLTGCGIIITLSLMLTASPAIATESPPQTATCQIERIEILEERRHQSTFKFKPIYNMDQDTCHGKVQWRFVMKSCNQSEEGPVTQTCSGNKEDVCKINMEGSYQVQMNGKIISECFTLPGIFLEPRATLVLRDTSVHLSIKPDERVESWNLTAYEAIAKRNEKNPVCSKERVPEILPQLFEKPFLRGNSFSVPFSFSLDKCYCFKIKPNGYDIELGFPTSVIKSMCRPVSSEPLPPVAARENHTWIIVGVVVVAVLLMSIMACVIGIQLRRRRMISAFHREGKNLVEVSQNVLVIYAQQERSHTRRVRELVRSLQSSGKSKIYDVHANADRGKLVDPNEWLRQRIMRDRILILLSPTLRQHLEIVFSVKRNLTAKENGYTVDAAGMDPTLVHALRILIGENDYSKIFVASFSSEQFEEAAGDFSEAITKERRYTLPEHLQELKTDMLFVRENKGYV